MIFVDKLSFRFILVSIMMFLLLLTGCSHVSQLPSDKSTLPMAQDKINLKVKLVIPSDFHNANYSTNIGSDTFTVQLGKNLENYANQLLVNVFTHPLTKEINNNENVSGDVYTITPKIKSVVLVRAGSKWDEQWITVCMEWSLRDKNGKLKWKESVIGRVKDVSYALYDTAIPHFLSLSIHDVFEKSQNAMLSSRVLRRL